MTWDVKYEDGEVEAGLCKECVRPFFPYKKGEKVDWLNEDDEYVAGHIVAVHDGGDQYDAAYSFKVGGRVINNVSSSKLRRSFSIAELATVGSRVLSKFPGTGEKVFPGEIVNVNNDGTFAIRFDDGDFLDTVDQADVVSFA